MYLAERFTGKTAKVKAVMPAPLGAGFAPDVASKAHSLEVWASSFKDFGKDYCIFKILDDKDKVIAEKTVPGY